MNGTIRIKHSMRKIKIKLKKKTKPKLKKIIPKEKLKLPKIKKIGRWCNYYENRLPSPMECSYNKQTPIEYMFTHGEKKLIKSRMDCVKCKRYVTWVSWKNNVWNNIKEQIKKGEDLRDQPSPVFYEDE